MIKCWPRFGFAFQTVCAIQKEEEEKRIEYTTIWYSDIRSLILLDYHTEHWTLNFNSSFLSLLFDKEINFQQTFNKHSTSFSIFQHLSASFHRFTFSSDFRRPSNLIQSYTNFKLIEHTWPQIVVKRWVKRSIISI